MRAKSIIVIMLCLLSLFWLPATAMALDGQVIVEGKCTACHSTDRIKSARKSAGDWAIQVDKEINRGAQLNSDERNAVIQYLAANYGTSTPAAQTTPVTPDPAASASATTTVTPPKKQAYTGIEMWQLVLAGSSFIGSGVFIRRKK